MLSIGVKLLLFLRPVLSTMFSTKEGFIENVATAASIAIALVSLGFVVIRMIMRMIQMLSIGVELLLFLRPVLSTMFSTKEAFKENGATAASIASIAIALLFLGRVVIPMLSIGVKLLLLSLVWVALYCLQPFLVGKRRCSRDWYVQYTAMAAYYLPTPVALCAASALYHFTSTHIDNYTSIRVCGIVGMLFFTISFSTQPGLLSSNMRAYSLGDRRRNRSDLLMWLVFLGSIYWEWCWTTDPNWRGLLLLPAMSVLCVTACTILFDKPPYSTLDCEAKAVADYMKRRKSSKSSSTSSPFFDANSNNSLQLLDCCRYPFVIGNCRYPFVIGKRKEGEWTTVQDLFDQCGNLSDGDKEVCLSYSLSRLLARRYYGFHCAEEGDDIVRRFVLADLQPTDDGDLGRRDGYDRAFRIVEVQLAFLHDYFFTASFTNIKSGFRDIISSSLHLSIGFGAIITVFLFAIEIQNELVILKFIQMVLIMCLSLCVVFGMPMSFLVKNLVASYWRPILTAFHNPKCLSDGPLRIIDPFQTEAGGAYWSNKIGQYSILQDFNRHRSLKKEIVAWFKGNILSEPSYGFIKHLPVEDEEVDIKNLDSMRKLVADTLWDIDGPPTNGTKSLKTNLGSSVYENDWSWICREETHTHAILIWHIATCYCGISPPHSNMLEEEFPLLDETETFHKVATALSRYCTYLVAFLPEFLPEHSLITKEVFQRVLQEAKDALGSMHMEEREKHTKIRKLELPLPDEQTTFHKGVRLGRQLEKLNTRLRWKVMAEFWAETILYIAPSDNAEAHIEHLAKGGEFITHLWAMLSNAGILKRATEEWHPLPTSTTTGKLCSSCRGPLTQTEITNVQTQTEITNVHSNEEAPATSTFSPPSSHRGQPSKYTAEEKGKQPEIQEYQ